MPAVRHGLPQEIEPNWKFHVGGVEIHHVLNAVTWYEVEQFRGKIAVRVYDADAVAGGDVLQNHVAEQGRLAGAAFADGVKVMATVARRKNKGGFLPPSFPNP